MLPSTGSIYVGIHALHKADYAKLDRLFAPRLYCPMRTKVSPTDLSVAEIVNPSLKPALHLLQFLDPGF